MAINCSIPSFLFIHNFPNELAVFAPFCASQNCFGCRPIQRSLNFSAVHNYCFSISTLHPGHQVWMYAAGSSGLTCVFQAFVETSLNEFPQLSELLTQRPLACTTRVRQNKKRRGVVFRRKRWENEHVRQMCPIISCLNECSPFALCIEEEKNPVCFCFALLCTRP